MAREIDRQIQTVDAYRTQLEYQLMKCAMEYILGIGSIGKGWDTRKQAAVQHYVSRVIQSRLTVELELWATAEFHMTDLVNKGADGYDKWMKRHGRT
jgi:hypothetical protein